MLTLKNNYLTVQINPLGAELTSVQDNESHLEYMWTADKAYWGRHAPFLFPIVGRLQDNHYRVNGQTYELTQHGFARDREFTVAHQTDTTLTLVLSDDAATHERYPFAFRLAITYTLNDHELRVAAQITNTGEATMPFAFGAHPGFNLPLGGALADFNDYNVRVAPKGVYERVPLVGPYSDTQHPVPLDLTKPLVLDHALFDHDAQVLTLNNRETTVMISTPNDDHGITLTLKAPYLGIWSPYPKRAPFVCLEPWWGLADDVHATGDLETKVAIQHLQPAQQFDAGFQITYF